MPYFAASAARSSEREARRERDHAAERRRHRDRERRAARRARRARTRCSRGGGCSSPRAGTRDRATPDRPRRASCARSSAVESTAFARDLLAVGERHAGDRVVLHADARDRGAGANGDAEAPRRRSAASVNARGPARQGTRPRTASHRRTDQVMQQHEAGAARARPLLVIANPPVATAALSGAHSNPSSSSSQTDSGSVRRNSIMFCRPSARNLRPSPSSGSTSPSDDASSRARASGRALEESGQRAQPRGERRPLRRVRRRMRSDRARRRGDVAGEREEGARPDRDRQRMRRRVRAPARRGRGRARSNPGAIPDRAPSGAAQKPGANSTSRPCPPSASPPSSTSTRSPAWPRRDAATSPFAPAPITITSNALALIAPPSGSRAPPAARTRP